MTSWLEALVYFFLSFLFPSGFLNCFVLVRFFVLTLPLLFHKKNLEALCCACTPSVRKKTPWHIQNLSHKTNHPTFWTILWVHKRYKTHLHNLVIYVAPLSLPTTVIHGFPSSLSRVSFEVSPNNGWCPPQHMEDEGWSSRRRHP